MKEDSVTAFEDELREGLRRVKPVNAHSHHFSGEDYRGMDLMGVLRGSYCQWMDDADHFAADMEGYLRRNECNSYFRWLFAALEHLYGLPLTPESADEISARIRQAHSDPGKHIRILKEECNYERVLLDCYRSPGSDHGHPELFAPVLRCNMFAVCSNKEQSDHNGNNPFRFFGRDFKDFGEYLEEIRLAVRRYPAVKFAIAYDRGNRIRNFQKERAQKAFMDPNPSPGQQRDYYEYMVYAVCRMAGEAGIPVQFHTGLGRLRQTAPMYLRRLIEALPETRFDLFHGGFPWTDDMLGLLHNMKNVWVNLCWMPIVSFSASVRFLREALEVADAHRILWGCDTWTSEESYGAMLATLHCLAKALAGMVRDGAISKACARYAAERIWRGNGLELYRLE